MIKPERVQELIQFHQQNLQQIDTFANMMGGRGNPMVEMTRKISKDLTRDTIKALQEYKDMASVKNMIEGG